MGRPLLGVPDSNNGQTSSVLAQAISGKYKTAAATTVTLTAQSTSSVKPTGWVCAIEFFDASGNPSIASVTGLDPKSNLSYSGKL